MLWESLLGKFYQYLEQLVEVLHYCWIFTDSKECVGVLQKELLIAPFTERFKTVALGKIFLIRFTHNYKKTRKHWISAEIWLMEVSVQGTLLKELHIPPFLERFKIATLGRSYWWILPLLGLNYLNIEFLLNFWLWEIMYRVLYERI